MPMSHLEKQLFALQEISKPLHVNEEALNNFLKKQVTYWVNDAGYDSSLVETLVGELSPIMGKLTNSNIAQYKEKFSLILEQHVGTDVEVNWVEEPHYRSA